jgi:hypothetical protein
LEINHLSMKYLIIILSIFSLVACENTSKSKEKTYNFSNDWGNFDAKIVVIDGCEYLTVYKFLTHKGNCRFCEERKQAILKIEKSH